MSMGVTKVGVHITVEGTVQGVGYRYFVVQQARRLGIVGWVRNLANGDVELEAQGEKKSLENFTDSLRTGHPWASVRQVKLDWVECTDDFDDFAVRF